MTERVTEATVATGAGAADDAIVGVIESDLTCVVCGYNLRAQRREGLCPECGQPIRQTLEFPHLIRSAPRWLVSLRDSLAVLLAALLADVVGVMTSSQNRWSDRLIDLCLAAVPWALAWFGVWLLTRPEPGHRPKRASARIPAFHPELAVRPEFLSNAERAIWMDRKLATHPNRVARDHYGDHGDDIRRWTLRAFATMPYIAFFLSATRRAWWVMQWWGPALMFGLLLGALPATFLYYDHLRRSALRLPRPGLAMLAGVTRWLAPLCMLGGMLQWAYVAPRMSLVAELHTFPRPVLPGAQGVDTIWFVILAGTELLNPSMYMRTLTAVLLLWSAFVLTLFLIAFASAARASVKGPL